MKMLLTLLALVAGIGLAPGQGITHIDAAVAFFNDETANCDHRIIGGDGQPLVGTQYAAELYGPTAGNSLASLPATLSRFKASTTSAPGTWSGKTYDLTTLGVVGGGVDISDVEGREVQTYPITLEVKIWDASQFATYELAVAGRGVSGTTGPFTYIQRYSSPPAITDLQMVAQPGVLGIPCPEPSAVVLGVLGVTGLLIFRGRKGG